MRRWLCVVWSLFCDPGIAADHGVILTYHHVAVETPRSTSITPERFAAQLDYIEDQGFSVWPLPKLLRALSNNTDVPEDVVVLTFDDAYESVFTEVFPALSARGWPFTVFVATDPIDGGYRGYMTWAQIRELAGAGVTIGNHSLSHAHLVRRATEERKHWEERVRQEILAAQEKIDAGIGTPGPAIFSYPYGEFSAELQRLVAGLGYTAVGQQSGVASRGQETAVPRFPIATGFDSIDDLAVRLHARPLPVEVSAPDSRIVDAGSNPRLVLKTSAGPFDIERLRCFGSGQGAISHTVTAGEVSLEGNRPMLPGRNKYTCTVPANDAAGGYFWYSHLWLVPDPEGRFPD